MRNRWYKILFSLFAVCGIVAMSSCVYDDYPIEDGDSSLNNRRPKDGKISIRLNIKQLGGNASRAPEDGEFVDGNDIEQKIGTEGNFLVFFDEDKNFYGATLLDLFTTENHQEEVVEKVYTATIAPDDFDEDPYDNLPKYCLVILNGKKYFEKFSAYSTSNTYEDVISEICKENDPRMIGIDETGYFTMTNSVYFDEGDMKRTLVTIDKDMIFDPSDPSRVSLFPKGNQTYTAPILTVYVERLVAKFNFGVANIEPNESGEYVYMPDNQDLLLFNGFTDEDEPKYSSRIWRICVTGWNVNAIETEEYLFKKIDGNTPYFDKWDDWKDPNGYRTFWSVDPHYDGPFPLQYRKSLIEKLNYYEDFENRGVNPLRNYSFVQLGLNDKNFEKTVYTPENTYSTRAALRDQLDLRADVLAGTHVLVGARLEMQDETGEFKVQDLWRDREGLYYKSADDYNLFLLKKINIITTSQDSMLIKYHDWENTGIEQPKGLNYTLKEGDEVYAKTKGKFYLYYNDEIITESDVASWGKNFLAIAEDKNGDGRRFPWPQKGKFSVRDENGNYVKFYVHNKTYDADGKLSDKFDKTDEGKELHDTDNLMKSLLHDWLGLVDHFDNGKMYYAAPALIMEGLGNNDTKKQGDSWAKHVCGVVRNAWYQYSLTDISGVGTPVDDPDQPIVPDQLFNFDHLNLTFKIIDWAEKNLNWDFL